MTYSLRWTPEAVKTLKQNLEYLTTEWDNHVINNFLDRVEGVLNTIEENPLLYPLHRTKENIRKCIVNKRIILFYKIIDDRYIDLLTFWNTYQNPNDLRF